jgi:hypothetical protein
VTVLRSVLTVLVVGFILGMVGAEGAARIALAVAGVTVLSLGLGVWIVLSRRERLALRVAQTLPPQTEGPAGAPAPSVAVAQGASTALNRSGYVAVRTPRGRIVGVWFANEAQAMSRDLVLAVLAKLGVLDFVGQGWQVQRNRSDDRGGAFVMFESADGLTLRGAAGEAAVGPLPDPYEEMAARLAALVPDCVADYSAFDADQRRLSINDGYLDQLIFSDEQPEEWAVWFGQRGRWTDGRWLLAWLVQPERAAQRVGLGELHGALAAGPGAA